MALKAGYKGIKKCGPGLKYDNLTGTLKLDGESDLSLDNLKDVAITTPLDGDILSYDATNEVWENIQPDSDPTEDSSNVVSSGGVYAAIEDITDLIPEGASTSNKLATASDVNDLWSANAVLGAKNILPIKFDYIKSKNTDGTWSGNTYTVGSTVLTFMVENGYVNAITFNGTTPSAGIGFVLCPLTDYVSKSVILNGSVSGVTDAYLQAYLYDGTNSISADNGADSNAFTITNGVTNNSVVRLVIRSSGTYPSNIVFKPMLRLATDTDSTYAPYAMTNGELTEAVTQTTSVLTISSNADLPKLKNGMNAVKFASGMVIGTGGGAITLDANYRGYIVRDDTTLNGIISNFDATNIYYIASSDNMASVPFYRKITTS